MCTDGQPFIDTKAGRLIRVANLVLAVSESGYLIHFQILPELGTMLLIFRLYFEFPATGGVFPRQEFTTVKLLKYTNTGDYALMACEIMFCLFILYYVIEEMLEIKTHGITYFFSFWNILDIVVIGVRLSQ